MFDNRYFPVLCILIYYLILFSCKKNNPSDSITSDPVLVTYNNKQLKYSEVSDHITGEAHGSDSLQLIASFTEKWIKDQIMIREAKSAIKDHSSIDKLTEDFRNDFFILKFEEELIKEKLDTLISDTELIEYYKSNKSRYKLESTIFRFIFVKAIKPISDQKNLDNLWKTTNARNLQLLNLYCQNNADVCFLNPDRWYKWEEIKKYLPTRQLSENNIQSGVNKDFSDSNYAYKLKFFEVVKPNQEPPLSFLREQAAQAILHQRKILLLEKIKADLYEKELRNKKIIFPNK